MSDIVVNALSLVAADINGDGLVDLASASYLRVEPGRKDGPWRFSPTLRKLQGSVLWHGTCNARHGCTCDDWSGQDCSTFVPYILAKSTCGDMAATRRVPGEVPRRDNSAAVRKFSEYVFNGTATNVTPVADGFGDYFPAGCFVAFDQTVRAPVGHVNTAFSSVQPGCGPAHSEFCVCGGKLSTLSKSKIEKK